jgi:hypothetical protein
MKKAAVAVAHRLLRLIYSLIATGEHYHEPGGDFFDRQHPERTAKRLSRRLQNIGFDVTIRRRPIDPVPAALAVPDSVCAKCHRWRLARCIHYQPHPKRPHPTQSPSLHDT